MSWARCWRRPTPPTPTLRACPIRSTPPPLASPPRRRRRTRSRALCRSSRRRRRSARRGGPPSRRRAACGSAYSGATGGSSAQSPSNWPRPQRAASTPSVGCCGSGGRRTGRWEGHVSSPRWAACLRPASTRRIASSRRFCSRRRGRRGVSTSCTPSGRCRAVATHAWRGLRGRAARRHRASSAACYRWTRGWYPTAPTPTRRGCVSSPTCPPSLLPGFSRATARSMSAVGASGCRACCPQSNGRANATRPTLPPEARGIGARTSAPAPAFAAGASECGGLRCSLGLRASGRGGGAPRRERTLRRRLARWRRAHGIGIRWVIKGSRAGSVRGGRAHPTPGTRPPPLRGAAWGVPGRLVRRV
mmetsp:Transcript_19015/g.51534  ORF Transcript_19015/g.51534 Transcript_19015/m.51534 type:complete len:361 (+) Transcript_19015:1448-2530(+)